MRLTGRLGRFFTQRPKYPKGSKGTSRITWPVALVILLVVAVLIGGGYILRRMQGSPKTPTTQPTPGAATSAK
jgi:cytoskeletal protein RodZ